MKIMNYDWLCGRGGGVVFMHTCANPKSPSDRSSPALAVCVPGPALICEMHTESQCGGNRDHCFPEDRLAARAINYKRQGDRQLAS